MSCSLKPPIVRNPSTLVNVAVVLNEQVPMPTAERFPAVAPAVGQLVIRRQEVRLAVLAAIALLGRSDGGAGDLVSVSFAGRWHWGKQG